MAASTEFLSQGAARAGAAESGVQEIADFLQQARVLGAKLCKCDPQPLDVLGSSDLALLRRACGEWLQATRLWQRCKEELIRLAGLVQGPANGLGDLARIRGPSRVLRQASPECDQRSHHCQRRLVAGRRAASGGIGRREGPAELLEHTRPDADHGGALEGKPLRRLQETFDMGRLDDRLEAAV